MMTKPRKPTIQLAAPCERLLAVAGTEHQWLSPIVQHSVGREELLKVMMAVPHC